MTVFVLITGEDGIEGVYAELPRAQAAWPYGAWRPSRASPDSWVNDAQGPHAAQISEYHVQGTPLDPGKWVVR